MSPSVCIMILLGLPLVRADFWDDFSNNLATDLAPLLSLFGERVTMQYLSESITIIDYFIFAMAPMGILTALVSAIRVRGSASLRAFVGRAQEGAGNSEAELCSSTSRNVCELYNNGGIARVFGRPKILEVVHDPLDPDFELTAGIYTFQDYIKTENGKASWKEVGTRTDMESRSEDIDSGPFAPNLSLNIGIKRKSDTIFWGVAVFGAILQVGVLVYAGIITYYLQWGSENSTSVEYACPLAIVGTLLVCSGVFYCAYLVGESTNERVYCRASSADNHAPRVGTRNTVPALYWLQPGGQVLGDQTFDAFGYSDRDRPLQKYLNSWKRRSREKKRRIWEAVFMTTMGFLMQFIGLRGIHPTASIAQLGAIIVMSAVRASLRMQRLKPHDNFLVDCPDEVVGYELDWLALCIGRDTIQKRLKLTQQELPRNSSEERREFWEFCGTSKHFSSQDRSSPKLNAAYRLLAYRRRLAELTQSTSLGSTQANSPRQFRDDMVKVKSMAKQLAKALGSATDSICSRDSGSIMNESGSFWWELDCSVATRAKSNKQQNDPSYQRTFPVHIRLVKVDDSSWKLLMPLEIEAILGLWVWSLVSDFSMETQDNYDHVRISRAFEVPTQRIISTSKDYRDLMLWTDIHVAIDDATIDCKDAQSARPANIFTRKLDDSDTYEPLVSDLPQYLGSDYRPRVVRYFGWYNIETCQIRDLDSGSDDLTLITTSAGSLVSCCAQEIFGSFIKSLLSQISNVEHISVEEGPEGFRLSNTLLKDLIEVFVSSELGSEEDAVSCVLPAMFSHLRNPPIELAFQIAMATLKKHRESRDQYQWMKNWYKRELIMRWAWNICKQPTREDEVQLKDYARLCAMTLGELYRSTLTRGYSRRIGRVGIEWLLDERLGQSKACCEAIDCYSTVLEELDKMRSGRQNHRLRNKSNSISSLLFLTLSSIVLEGTPKESDIYEAAGHGWAEVVLAALTSGADPDLACEGMRSQTPLHHAVEYGHAHVVDILIGWGASQYCRSSEGLSALDLAVLHGHHIVVKSLLDTFDPTLVSDCRGTNIRGKTALHIAAEQEDKRIVKLLIDSGKFNLESRDDDGNTPLHVAADRLAETPVERLVDAQEPATEIQKDDSRNPLDMAIHKGQEATLRMFFDIYQIDPEGRDYQGNTPLDKAVRHGQETIVKLLIDTYNVDPESKQNERRRPLHHAAELPETEMAQLLLDTYHLDPNSRDFEGMTPLHVAIKHGRNEVAKVLLGVSHVDREVKDVDGVTPLHLATRSPDGQIARLLIDTYHVNPDVQDSYGTTPLECAILADNFSLIDFMISVSGEKTRAKALLLAKKEGYDQVVDLLARKAEQLEDSEKKQGTIAILDIRVGLVSTY